ncbi:hypothetical protein DPMN_148653 [Dreissena polymorpha]|uniref:Uncharacterized protein n=1 Tax=Dreissena polymorpha TaxID=45954 RepID=A0A9D4J475_DREPO|nr:hypothetical protein DPMN_148653 [Dreissena polymorpha]
MARQRPTRLVMGPCIIEIDQVQYQLEVNRCRKEEIMVKGNFGWVWSMWAGRPRGSDVVYLVMGPCIVEIYRIVIRECRSRKWPGRTDGQTTGQPDRRLFQKAWG